MKKDFKSLIDFKDIKSGCRDSKDARHGSHSKFAFLDNLFCDSVKVCYGKKAPAMSEKLYREFDEYMEGTDIEKSILTPEREDWFKKKTFDKYKGNQVPKTDSNYVHTIHLRIFSYYMESLCENDDFLKLLEDRLEEKKIAVPGATAREKLHYMLSSTFGDLYKKHYALSTGLNKYVSGSKTLPEGSLVNPEEGFMAFAKVEDSLMENDVFSPYFVTIGNGPFVKKLRLAYLPIYSITGGFLADKKNLDCSIDNQIWKINDQIKCLLDDPDDSEEEKEAWITEKVEEERADAIKRGYYDQPDLLWIRSMTFDDRKRMTIRCGHTEEDGYLYHKVWNKAFFDACGTDWAKVEHNPYFTLLDNPADKLSDYMITKNGPYHITRAGGGIWLITSDGYIACAKRAGSLEDEPGKISYSASGSFENTGWDWAKGMKDSDGEYGPFAQISKEVREEIGIRLNTDDIWMSEAGIDLYGGWIQFSFFAAVPYTAAELSAERNRAADKKECTLFFIPYSEAEAMLLDKNTPEGKSYSIEASARYSLFHIIEKYKKFSELPKHSSQPTMKELHL